jgi:hypothetical protein
VPASTLLFNISALLEKNCNQIENGRLRHKAAHKKENRTMHSAQVIKMIIGMFSNIFKKNGKGRLSR